jgi:cell division protein FtsW (lipid II flippase)
MIAKTFAGNNLLGLGLISHVTAIIIAMVPFQETESLIAYLMGSLLLSLAILIELLGHQESVFKNWHFYAASILSLLAVIGPIFACWILYILSDEENKHPKTAGGFITSIFALKVHPIALLIWTIAIIIPLAILAQQYDPYFSHSIPQK